MPVNRTALGEGLNRWNPRLSRRGGGQTVVHKPANIITFILGDNDEKIGDDCYMWFYRVDN